MTAHSITLNGMEARLWGASAYDWAYIQEPKAAPLWRDILDVTDVRQGTKLLDAGCGAGGAAIMAARRGADVGGVDVSSSLVHMAKKRMPEGTFAVADMERLPFRSEMFDVAIAVNSLQYVVNRKRALEELHRVLKPGGRVAVATWADPRDCENRYIFRAVKDCLPIPTTGELAFALAMPGVLEELLVKSGFEPTLSGDADCPFVYEDMLAAWRGQSSAGPLQGMIRTVGEIRVRQAVLPVLAKFGGPNGVRLKNRFRYVVATNTEL